MNIVKESLIINISYYLMVSLPFLLITGPFLSDIALTLSSLLIVFLLVKKKNILILKTFSLRFF